MISPMSTPLSSYYAPAGGRSARAASPTSGGIHVPMRGENYVYFGGDGQGQTVYARYTEDSTPEDPVVRISGNSLSGGYEKVVHINDIDPNRASYAELCALMGHKANTGEYKPEFGRVTPVPLGVDRGDFAKPQNFMRKIRAGVSSHPHDNLLEIYDKILAELAQPDRDTSESSLRDYASHSQTIASALMAFSTRGFFTVTG